MRRLLETRDLQLTRSLGQNFMHDANQLRRIVAAGELTPQDRVLEIGPGLGPLTERLLASAGEVLAIEKDARLAAILRERFPPGQPPGDRLTVSREDALESLRREPRDWRQWKLVANLPYSVGSPILVELALAPHPPERLVVTLQLEVVKRLMAGPGEADYGLLTLLVGLNFEAGQWFKVPAGCFFPEPDVDSGCLALARRSPPPLSEAEQRVFVRLAKTSFSQRRKMMLKLLKREWGPATLERAFDELGLPPQTRAENVSREQFLQLARRLAG